MSDRFLIAGATVPMLCSVAALVLLQRAPGVRASRTEADIAAAAPAFSARADRNPWVGVVVAGSTAELAANADGRVQVVFVRTGARVQAGARLMQFDLSESANSVGMAGAQLNQRMSELSRAEARAQAAGNQLKRLRGGETWLSKQELDVATAESRMADADLQSARAGVGVSRLALNQQRLRATRQTLTAPFAGTVVSVNADMGGSVTAGQVVMRILSEDRQVRFAFPPGDMPSSAQKQVTVQLTGTDSSVETEVSAVRPDLDPSAQLIFATAQLPENLPEASRWIPGAAVQVRLVSQARIYSHVN
jgi:RND family efflux transporter MFP subunit